MSKTKAAKDPSVYLDLVEKSQLLTAEQMDQARGAADGAADSKALARRLVRQKLLTSWQASQLLAGWHDLTIGKYQLCRQLGKSQVARVFLAEHPQMGRQVALKTLSRRFTSEPNIVKRFLADARAAAALDHRNIIHVYDVDSADDRYFLVMEHVEGSDLRRVLRENGPLAPEQAADFIRQAARGLAYAHERDLLHRDLKPAKLMIDDQRVVKILALGLGQLSELEQRDHPDEGGDMAAGFPAPEDLASGAEPGPQSDIYALGATFYCLLTGKPPTPELGARDLLRQRRDLPEDLARICVRMMARSPAKRFASASDVELALDDWLAVNAPTPEETIEEMTAVELDSAEVDSADEIEPLADLESVGDAETGNQFEIGPKASTGGGPPAGFDWAPDNATQLPAHVESRLPRSRRRKTKTKTKANSNTKSNAAPQTAPAAMPPATVATANDRAAPGVKSKGKTSAKTSAKTKGKPKSKPKGKRQAESSEKKTLPLGLLIGAGAAAVLVGGLFIAGIAFLVFRSGSDADAGAQGQVADASQAGDSDSDAEDSLESDPEDSLESDPEDPLESDPESPAGSGQAGPDDTGEPKPGEPKPGEPAQPTDQTGDGNTEPPADSGPPGSSKPPTDGAKQPTGQDPEGQNPPADTSEKPVKPEPDKPEPDKPKPKPKPAPKPFAGFPKLVSLPAPDEAKPGEPIKLGPVQIPENRTCYVKLRGGANACKGKSHLEMKNARNGTAERDWEVFLIGSKRGGGKPMKVADLTIKEGQLLFQWTAQASDDPESASLRNCGLSMNVGPEIHEVVLRKPAIVEPIVLDLDKAVDIIRVDIPTPPRAASIRFQVTRLEGPFPPHVLEPDQLVPATKGEQTVKLGKQPADQVLEFQLDLDIKRDLQVTIAPFFRWPLDRKPVKMTKVNVRKAEQVAVVGRQQLAAKLEQARQYVAQNKQQAAQQGLTAQVSLMEQQLAKLEAAVQAIEKLKGLYAALNEKGRMHFRVVYDADGIEVVLASSQ